MFKTSVDKEFSPDNSRLSIIGLIFTTIIVCLGIKLYNIMVEENASAVLKMEQQIYKPAIYFDGFDFVGNIYDHNMRRLTNDGMEYKAVILPHMAWKRFYTFGEKYNAALNVICESNPSISYDWLAKRIKDEYDGNHQAVVVKIDEKAFNNLTYINFLGIYPIREKRRFGDKIGFSITSNFTSNVLNNNNLKQHDSIDMEIFNYISRYTKKILKIPVDAQGNNLPGLPIVEDTLISDVSDDAKDIVLTLDYDIQRVAEEILNELCAGNGAVSIIDIKTGGVSAMASKDINGWERNIVNYSGKDYAYNPGSIFKIVVLAAALENGKVAINTKYTCNGKDSSTGISCYKTDGHGLIGLEDAFAYSCNVYFIELARQVGPDKIIAMAERMGFGSKVLDFSRESKGMLYVDKKDIRYDIGNIAIGQKDIMVTPIQVCRLVSTVANNGIMNKPYILDKVLNDDGSVFRQYGGDTKRIISVGTAEIIQRLMEGVVNYGTGKRAYIYGGSAGKTGTPQRGSKLPTGKYQYEDGWFAGYFPAIEPRFAVSVYIEDNGDGSPSSSIAPLVFKAIAEKMLLLNK